MIFIAILTELAKVKLQIHLKNADLNESRKLYKTIFVYITKKWINKISFVKLKLKNFHQHKNRISIYNVDINKILELDKISFGKMGFKHFIGYEDGKKVGPL